MCTLLSHALYQPRGSDALWLGSQPWAWQKVMTAYHRVYDQVTCGLTAKRLGSLSLVNTMDTYLHMFGGVGRLHLLEIC